MAEITPELFAFGDLAGCGLFDAGFYARQYTDLQGSPLRPILHYFAYGAPEGRWPNAYFDPAYYRDTHAPPGTEGLDLLLHYLRAGEAEDHQPSPLFDTAWYRAAYAIPRTASPLADFLANQRTRTPLPTLWAVARMATYRDRPDPVAAYAAEQDDPRAAPPCPDPAVIRASGLFDENYYLINGADVMEAALDPVDHFCAYGWREGRNPNFYFDTAFYLRTNPSLERLGVNPLVHYILEGEAAGRRPVVYFDPVWYRSRYAVPAGTHPLAHWMANRRSQNFSPTPLFDADYYMANYRDLVGPNRDPFAHYLQAGTYRDLDPSAAFDSAAYRRRTLGRPSKHFKRLVTPESDNPLVHHLLADYA